MSSLSFRIALYLTLVFVTALLAWTLIARAVEPPLPALLYANRTTLRVRAPGCTSLVGPCAQVDRPLLDGLDRTQAVSSWSPDGGFIAAHFSDRWLVYRADCLLHGSACPGVPLESDAEMSMRIAWGPGGSAMAYLIRGGSTLRILSRDCWTDDSAPCRRIDVSSPYNMGQPAWSADGRIMAFSGAPHGVFLLDTRCLTAPATCQLSSIAVDPDQYWWPSPAHNGHRVLYNTYGNRIYQKVFLLDLVTGVKQVISARRDDAFQPAWDASERYVAFVSLDGLTDDANLNIYAYDLERGLTAQAVGLPGNDTFPSWVPPGQSIH